MSAFLLGTEQSLKYKLGCLSQPTISRLVLALQYTSRSKMNMTGHSQGQLIGHSQDQLFLTQNFKLKILDFKTLSAGLFTTRVHGRETLAVSSLIKLKLGVHSSIF